MLLRNAFARWGTATLRATRPAIEWRAASSVAATAHVPTQSQSPASSLSTSPPTTAASPDSSQKHTRIAKFGSSASAASSPSALLTAEAIAKFLPDNPSTTVLNDAIAAAAKISQTGVSLRELTQFGVSDNQPEVLLQAAAFLARELPIRFAHRIVELHNLPYGMSELPEVNKIIDWYRESFKDLMCTPIPRTLEEEAEWSRMLNRIYERHAPTTFTMAKAVLDLKAKSKASPLDMESNVFPYLDRFYTSRIGIRTLIAQHLALHDPVPGFVGIINTKTSPVEVAEAAISDARYMCERAFGEAPDVHVFGDASFTFPYVAEHLHHIMFELVKNSLRAVVEQHGEGDMPPVKVVVSADKEYEDVVIKVSDEGGGIPRSAVSRIWSYFYTTYGSQSLVVDAEDSADFSRDAPLAGLGCGLPLSRLFARYFGGDLQVISMEGYGTDAYVHLRNVGDAQEPVPECEVTSM